MPIPQNNLPNRPTHCTHRVFNTNRANTTTSSTSTSYYNQHYYATDYYDDCTPRDTSPHYIYIYICKSQLVTTTYYYFWLQPAAALRRLRWGLCTRTSHAASRFPRVRSRSAASRVVFLQSSQSSLVQYVRIPSSIGS